MTTWDVELLTEQGGGAGNAALPSVDGMVVTVKPPNREEFALKVESPPRYSSAIVGGYEQAEVDCELDDEQREKCIGARLRVHGKSGIVWQGLVMRRPGRDEPLVAQGWGVAATLGRRQVKYCDTALSGWVYQETTANNQSWSVSPSVDTLQFSVPAGATSGQRTSVRYEIFPAVSSFRLSFTLTNNASATKMLLWVTDNGSGSTTASYTTASGTNYDYTGSAVTGITLIAQATATNTDAASMVLSDLKFYGASGVTTVTTHNVFDDIVLNEIVPQRHSSTEYFMPSGTAYYAYVDAEATQIEPLVFESCDAATKFSELTKYAANAYGWYTESVSGAPACVPHWTALSTTPDYIVRLDEAEGYDLDQSALDELASAVRVHYTRPGGQSVYKDVTDADTTHPLVAAGITRYADTYVESTSSATASAVGVTYLAENGRSATKGSVTTRYVYSSTGASAYLPDVRPGRMVRIYGLPDGQVDCIIKRVSMTGDAVAVIELDNDPYRLDITLAKLAKRAEARR